jgi:hypothetical protein
MCCSLLLTAVRSTFLKREQHRTASSVADTHLAFYVSLLICAEQAVGGDVPQPSRTWGMHTVGMLVRASEDRPTGYSQVRIPLVLYAVTSYHTSMVLHISCSA